MFVLPLQSFPLPLTLIINIDWSVQNFSIRSSRKKEKVIKWQIERNRSRHDCWINDQNKLSEISNECQSTKIALLENREEILQLTKWMLRIVLTRQEKWRKRKWKKYFILLLLREITIHASMTQTRLTQSRESPGIDMHDEWSLVCYSFTLK